MERERESENFCFVKFFYIVDQLLMRSLWLEKLTINDFAINSDFQIILLLKDQTNHYQVTSAMPADPKAWSPLVYCPDCTSILARFAFFWP